MGTYVNRNMKKVLYLMIICLAFLMPLNSSKSDAVNSLDSDPKQSFSHEGATLDKVEFYGNKIILIDKIQEIFSIKPGDAFNGENLKDNIRALYATNYFYKIDAVTDGGNEVSKHGFVHLVRD